MIAFALATSGRNAALQEKFFGPEGQLIRDNAQQAFPRLVAEVLPIGFRGVVVAGLLAALMSSLAGAFNASAAIGLIRTCVALGRSGHIILSIKSEISP